MDSSLLKDPLLGSEDMSSAHLFIYMVCGLAFEIVYSSNHSLYSHHTNISQRENKRRTDYGTMDVSTTRNLHGVGEAEASATGHACCFLSEGNGKGCFYQGKSVIMFTPTSRLKWGLKLE